MSDWKLVSYWGSLREGDPSQADAAFHAGHLNDVLRLNAAAFFPTLVASDSSGVWLVNELGGVAVPLSTTWDSLHLNCLAQGLNGDQDVTDTTTAALLFNWRRLPIQSDGEHPFAPGQIYRVIAMRERRRLVILSEAGVLWANIPPPSGGRPRGPDGRESRNVPTRSRRIRRPMLLIAFAVTGVELLAGRARAWGPVGHETVAYIAEDSLTPKAKAKLAALIGRDSDLASLSNWADQVRVFGRPETAPWHFIDIEDRIPESEENEPTFCKEKASVVDQVSADIVILKDPKSTQAQRFEPLKFLVHFVGDTHQPLHCANDDDRGGNEKIVIYKAPGGRSKKGTKIKLHALWDHLVEIKTEEQARELAIQLEGAITDDRRVKWAKGTPADRAWETFQIAHDTIYSESSPDATDAAGVPLPKDYYTKKMQAVAFMQLERAGVRLGMDPERRVRKVIVRKTFAGRSP